MILWCGKDIGSAYLTILYLLSVYIDHHAAQRMLLYTYVVIRNFSVEAANILNFTNLYIWVMDTTDKKIKPSSQARSRWNYGYWFMKLHFLAVTLLFCN